MQFFTSKRIIKQVTYVTFREGRLLLYQDCVPDDTRYKHSCAAISVFNQYDKEAADSTHWPIALKDFHKLPVRKYRCTRRLEPLVFQTASPPRGGGL